jgi:hypothetical protein
LLEQIAQRLLIAQRETDREIQIRRSRQAPDRRQIRRDCRQMHR